MQVHNNDNDTWQTLGLATQRLLSKLNEKEQEDGNGNADRCREDKQKAEEHRRYVEQRLRDIAAFEARYRPKERKSGG